MRGYDGLVRVMLARLLLIVAVLLMPAGMAPAATSASHHEARGMPMGHCPDPSNDHSTKQGIAECTMACAAALPAAVTAVREPPLIICEPLLPRSAQRLRGLHPETATPPPKTS